MSSSDVSDDSVNTLGVNVLTPDDSEDGAKQEQVPHPAVSKNIRMVTSTMLTKMPACENQTMQGMQQDPLWSESPSSAQLPSHGTSESLSAKTQ